MIEEKSEINFEIKISKSLDKEIENNFNAFKNKGLKKYSEDFLKNHIFENSFLREEDSIVEFSFIILSFLVLFSFGITSVILHNGYLLLGAISSMLMFFIINSEVETKKRCKKWMKKDDNLFLLKKSLFDEENVSQDILKLFIKEYGEDALITIMKNKDVVLYKDIKYYIKNREKIIKEQQEIALHILERQTRDIKIKEAVTCLLQE